MTFWWSALRTSTGLRSFDPEAGRLYSQSWLCLEAAARGDGATVGDEVTAQGHVASGRLVVPILARLPSPDAYYLVTPASKRPGEELRQFIDWLRSSADSHRQWWSNYLASLKKR